MPPLIYREAGDITGLEADFARQLAASLGRTPQFVTVPWEKQIDTLIAGRIDIIMSGMTATRPRAVRINFAQPYLREGLVALVRRDDAAVIQLGMFGSDYKVGAQRGTTGEFFAQNSFPSRSVVLFNTPKDGAKALLEKRITIFIHDAPVNWWLASIYETQGLAVIPRFLTEDYLAWGIRKDDAELLNAANQFLEKVRQDGQLRATVQRWLPGWDY